MGDYESDIRDILVAWKWLKDLSILPHKAAPRGHSLAAGLVDTRPTRKGIRTASHAELGAYRGRPGSVAG